MANITGIPIDEENTPGSIVRRDSNGGINVAFGPTQEPDFGDGSDGALNLTGNITLNPGDSEKQYTDVSLNGYTITIDGTDSYINWKISGTLDWGGGIIDAIGKGGPGGSGAAAGAGTGGDGGAGGGSIVIHARNMVGTGTIQADGVDGTTGIHGTGNPSYVGANGSGGATRNTVLLPIGAGGGGGGGGFNGNGGGGGGGAPTPLDWNVASLVSSFASSNKIHPSQIPIAGGGGGGAMSGADGTSGNKQSTGGGGGAGSTCALAAGNGGGGAYTNSTSTGNGGGGGGGGGFVAIKCLKGLPTLTINATGGDGFPGNGGGGTGGAGAAGLILVSVPDTSNVTAASTPGNGAGSPAATPIYLY